MHAGLMRRSDPASVSTHSHGGLQSTRNPVALAEDADEAEDVAVVPSILRAASGAADAVVST